MGNLKRRVERLERGLKGPGVPFIFVRPGETKEEAEARDLAEHPEHEKAEVKAFVSVAAPGPLSAPPTRPQSQPSDPVPAFGPLQITY
jgi:hypothetical protein